MKISPKDAVVKDRGAFVANVHIGDRQDFNFLTVEVKGRHPLTRMHGATRTYHVVEGEGTFDIDDQHYDARPGDTFVIGDGHRYTYEGCMRLAEFNVPATTRENSERLD